MAKAIEVLLHPKVVALSESRQIDDLILLMAVFTEIKRRIERTPPPDILDMAVGTVQERLYANARYGKVCYELVRLPPRSSSVQDGHVALFIITEVRRKSPGPHRGRKR